MKKKIIAAVLAGALAAGAFPVCTFAEEEEKPLSTEQLDTVRRWEMRD